jgi:hypothetical protein
LIESRKRIQVIIPKKNPEIHTFETLIATASTALAETLVTAKTSQTAEVEDVVMKDFN